VMILGYGIILSFVNAYKPVRGDFPPDRLAVTVTWCSWTSAAPACRTS